jgi:hypothetical protein
MPGTFVLNETGDRVDVLSVQHTKGVLALKSVGHRLLVLLACVSALAAVQVSGAQGFTVTTSNLHHWLWDAHHSVVDTTTEAVTVAKRNDIVVGQQRVYGRFLSAMHHAKPHIVVVPYHSSISVADTKFQWVLANHPKWLLRNQSGGLMHDSYGAYLINPASTGVRAWHVHWAKSVAAHAWDGVYLDSLGTYGLEGFGGIPINPATKKPFTKSGWLAATRGLAIAVNRAIKKPIVGNGLRDGISYYAGTYRLLDGLQAGVFEACFRGATFSVSTYPSLTNWRLQVRAIHAVQARGKRAICMVKAWGSGTAAQIQQWHDFSVASFLLVSGDRSYFSFSGARTDTALSPWTVDRLGIGHPMARRQRSGSVYFRRFSGGMVVVNPTGSASPMSLPGAYVMPNGARVSSLTLAAHTGLVLTQ